MKAIDTVKAIRCRDCERWGTGDDEYTDYKKCTRTGAMEPEDGFCWLPREKKKE